MEEFAAEVMKRSLRILGFPSTRAGQVAIILEWMSVEDEHGNPAPLITPAEALKLLNIPVEE